MKKTHRRVRRRYFSLIEIMVVVAIIGLLTGIVGVNVMNHYEKAKVSKAKSEVISLRDAVRGFYYDMGEFPHSLDALVQSPGSDKWNGPYLDPATVPDDPWGVPYHYDNPGQHGDFDIYSLGKDKAQGGQGTSADIVSWE